MRRCKPWIRVGTLVTCSLKTKKLKGASRKLISFQILQRSHYLNCEPTWSKPWERSGIPLGVTMMPASTLPAYISHSRSFNPAPNGSPLSGYQVNLQISLWVMPGGLISSESEGEKHFWAHSFPNPSLGLASHLCACVSNEYTIFKPLSAPVCTYPNDRLQIKSYGWHF